MSNRGKESRDWVAAQAGSGAGGTFAMAREKVPWTPCAPDRERSHIAVRRQREMDLLQQEWSIWWIVGQWHESASWPAGLGARPPRPSAELMREVSMTFKKTSGVGFDSSRPVQLLELGNEGLASFIDLIMAIDTSACWPTFCTNIASLQKRLGGVQSIALLHAVARVQTRLERLLA
eukprot:6363112-Pyramimonas_sp.AAC.1